MMTRSHTVQAKNLNKRLLIGVVALFSLLGALSREPQPAVWSLILLSQIS
jgi:hypothetical protein